MSTCQITFNGVISDARIPLKNKCVETKDLKVMFGLKTSDKLLQRIGGEYIRIGRNIEVRPDTVIEIETERHYSASDVKLTMNWVCRVCDLNDDNINEYDINMKLFKEPRNWDWLLQGIRYAFLWKRNLEASTRTMIDMLVLFILNTDDIAMNNHPLFVQSEISGLVHQNGLPEFRLKAQADYIISHTNQEYDELNLYNGICIIEAKKEKEDLKFQHTIQLIAECGVLFKHRLRNEKEKAYGVLSNFKEWKFIKIDEGNIFETKRVITIDTDRLQCVSMKVKNKESDLELINIIKPAFMNLYCVIMESISNSPRGSVLNSIQNLFE